MTQDLASALVSINWTNNVTEFATKRALVKRFDAGCRRLAIWNNQIGFQDVDGIALPFLQEMQASGYYVAATVAVGLYKPAAASMRSAVENALYYTYFRHHSQELLTQLSVPKFYVDKKSILEFHKTHTAGFSERQQKLGFISQLDSWYSRMSAIIHGQVPGVWSSRSLYDTGYAEGLVKAALAEFLKAVRLIDELLLLTIGIEFWEGFHPEARRLLVDKLPVKTLQTCGLETNA